MEETFRDRRRRLLAQPCPPDHRICLRCLHAVPLGEFSSPDDTMHLHKWCSKCRTYMREFLSRKGRTNAGRARKRELRLRWLHETFGGWVYYAWHNIRLRCGYLGTNHGRRHRQFDPYRSVTLELSKEQFYRWAYSQRTAWEELKADGKRPSIDRIDPAQGYALGNVRILDHHENVAEGARNSARVNNPKRRRVK